MLEWYQSTLPLRIAFGVTVFALLAFLDWRRNPSNPRCIGEYAFLLYGTAIASMYGLLHDQITVSISPEYFIVFKGLRPAPGWLRWETCKLSVLATYWVGLVLAAALLVANNPAQHLPQLEYGNLRRKVLLPLGCAVLGATGAALILASCGTAKHVEAYSGYLPVHAQHLLIVWGMHLGSYVGGALGGILAVWLVRSERRTIALS